MEESSAEVYFEVFIFCQTTKWQKSLALRNIYWLQVYQLPKFKWRSLSELKKHIVQKMSISHYDVLDFSKIESPKVINKS